MKFITITLLLVFSLVSSSAQAAEGKQLAARTFSLDTGYIPPLTTNQSMWNLQMEFSYLGTGIFDGVSNQTFLGSFIVTRAVWALAMLIIWNEVNKPVSVSQHELGHGARATAIGGNPYYYWDGSTSYPSIFPLVLEGLIGFKTSSIAYTSYDSSGTQPSDAGAIVGAGGMNNSMMYAEAVEDEVYFNKGHILLYPSYFWGKSDTYGYSRNTRTGRSNGGDVSFLMNYWSANGYNVGYDDLENGSKIAWLGSATNLSFLWSVLRYIGIGDPAVYAPIIGGFKLPDFSSFLYRRGVSIRSRFGFGSSAGKTFYPMSLEYVFRGSPAVEVSFGVRDLNPMAGVFKTGSLWQVFLCSAGGGGLRWTKDFSMGSSSYFTLGASVFSDSSLEGERTAGHYVTNNIGADAWGKLTWAY